MSVFRLVVELTDSEAGSIFPLGMLDLHKVLGETRPALPCLVDQSMIQCLVLCGVDTAILAVLSAGEKNMHSACRHVLHLRFLMLPLFAIQLFLSLASPG